MNIEHETRRTGLPQMLPHIQRMVEWARCANTYIDEHNAPPPDGSDNATREELIAAMDELGDLMQRYGDSLRRFADREPSSERPTAQNNGTGTAELGTLLQFPARTRSAPMPSRDGTDQKARPCA